VTVHLSFLNMRYVWSYSEHEIFIFLVFAIVIEAITASAPPVIDLGYALHQATISPVTPPQRPQNSQLISTGKPSLFPIPQHQICRPSPRSPTILVSSASTKQSLCRHSRWIIRQDMSSSKPTLEQCDISQCTTRSN
jgi:hypothetical protein